MKRILFSLFIVSSFLNCVPTFSIMQNENGEWVLDPNASDSSEEEGCYVCGRPEVQLGCGHSVLCRGCLERQLRLAAPENAVDNDIRLLECPAEGCNYELSEIEVQNNANDLALIERIRALRIVANPNGRHCPTPDCNHMYVHNPEHREVHRCPECRHNYCSDCRVPHGMNVDCDQVARERGEEFENGEFYKACPNCDVMCDKDDGCKFVRCNNCQTNFCWACLMVLARDHEDHECVNQGWWLHDGNPFLPEPRFMPRNPIDIPNINIPAMPNLWEPPNIRRPQRPVRRNWWEDFPVAEEPAEVEVPVRQNRPAVANFNRPLNRHNQWRHRAPRQQNRFQARRNNNQNLEKSLVIMASVATVALVITQWRLIKQKATKFKNWVGNKFSRNKKVIEQKNGHEVIVQ